MKNGVKGNESEEGGGRFRKAYRSGGQMEVGLAYPSVEGGHVAREERKTRLTMSKCFVGGESRRESPQSWSAVNQDEVGVQTVVG